MSVARGPIKQSSHVSLKRELFLIGRKTSERFPSQLSFVKFMDIAILRGTK